MTPLDTALGVATCGAVAFGAATVDRLYRRLRYGSPPAPATAAPLRLGECWPVVWRDCDGPCGRRHVPHEDHGDGTFTCHNCGHSEQS